VLLQYSVTEKWPGKIRATAERVRPKTPLFLIYVSSQEIGAKADDLKQEVFKKYGFRLDIRDRNWFVERVNATPERQAAAEELALKYVDPYLSNGEVFDSKATALESHEAKAAFVYLGLQWEDDTQEKGLTKLAFEALVCSALHGTGSDHRLPRGDVLAGVKRLLPSHDPKEVDRHTISALGRLAKRRIRHWRKEDAFCLSYEETLRVATRLLERERQELEFTSELATAVLASHPAPTCRCWCLPRGGYSNASFTSAVSSSLRPQAPALTKRLISRNSTT
jgi:hypothetical protein